MVLAHLKLERLTNEVEKTRASTLARLAIELLTCLSPLVNRVHILQVLLCRGHLVLIIKSILPLALQQLRWVRRLGAPSEEMAPKTSASGLLLLILLLQDGAWHFEAQVNGLN